MPKLLFRPCDVTSKISKVHFCTASAHETQRNAHVKVITTILYENAQTPMRHGLLDRRMGVSSGSQNCDTCKKGQSECLGHYGYLELPLPVYHIGHFQAIINILQIICKKCSRVMLKPEDRAKFERRLRDSTLTYLGKKAIHKQIVKAGKKQSVCPHCSTKNGSIKKGPGMLRIVYDRYRGSKKHDTASKDEMEEMLKSVGGNAEIRELVSSNAAAVVELNPLIVLTLFNAIPDCDFNLIGINGDMCHPCNLILTNMPVPPACIRPSVIMDTKRESNEDDITIKQTDILMCSSAIEQNAASGGKVNRVVDHWDMLQLHAALFINGELSGIPLNMIPKKSTRGIAQRLKGKQGRFRGNLSGKRVDFSSRTVISPDPNLLIHQVGVPLHIAKILTYPERVTAKNINQMRELVKNGPHNHPGAKYVRKETESRYLGYGDRKRTARELQIGETVERHLRDGDIVLFNRQPSLHKMSIMAHVVKVQSQRTFRFNECVCTPYNADFDGDEMNLHLPQTEEARAEAYTLMLNKSNLVTPKNGEILIAATQDFITGAYLITQKDRFLTKEQASQLIGTICAGDDSNISIELPPPCIMKPRRLWSGKQIFSLIMKPNSKCNVNLNLITKGRNYSGTKDLCINDSWIIVRNSKLLCGAMDKATLGSGTKNCIFYVMLCHFGEDVAAKCMWRLARIASYYLQNTGFSFGIRDVTPSSNVLKEKSALLEIGYQKCDTFINQRKENTLKLLPGNSADQSLEMTLLHELSDIREKSAKSCFKELDPTNSALIMALSGSKGSNINIAQMIACVGQQSIGGKRVCYGFEDRTLPSFDLGSATPAARGFVQNSFFSGLTPTEFFFHAMAGREGLVDTAVKTAETGYLQRRLTKCLEDLVVQYDGTVRNCVGEIVETKFGADGLDPVYMEKGDKPVDMDRLLNHVRAVYPLSSESEALDSGQIIPTAERILAELEFSESRDDFKRETLEILKSVANNLATLQQRYTDRPCISHKIECLTEQQMRALMSHANKRYTRAVMEPGSAVGAIAAQSIGEPGTQMTLKTFHFAGVAAMNISQGVPRIKEIINATENIDTPVIIAELQDNTTMDSARRVKGRIEATRLGEVTKRITVTCNGRRAFIIVELDEKLFKLLSLNVNVHSIVETISKRKLVNSLRRVEAYNSSHIIAHMEAVALSKGVGLNVELLRLQEELQNVVIAGIPTISRAIIHLDDNDTSKTYKLAIEGNGLREVIATYGVCGNRTHSNNICLTSKTLGIEAAFTTIVKEITSVLQSHGMTVDYRHIMLLANQMTATGDVLGITRNGLSKMRESSLNLASFEKTTNHLFDAAYYGQTDHIEGVSERIILGLPPSIGTNLFDLNYKHTNTHLRPARKTIMQSSGNY